MALYGSSCPSSQPFSVNSGLSALLTSPTPPAGRDPSPSLAPSSTPSTAHLALQLVTGVRSLQSRDMYKFTSMSCEKSSDWQAGDMVRMDGRMGGRMDETAREDGTSYFSSAVPAKDLGADTLVAAPGLQPDYSGVSRAHRTPHQCHCVQGSCSLHFPQDNPEVGSINIPTLQMGKLRLRETNFLARHRAGENRARASMPAHSLCCTKP